MVINTRRHDHVNPGLAWSCFIDHWKHPQHVSWQPHCCYSGPEPCKTWALQDLSPARSKPCKSWALQFLSPASPEPKITRALFWKSFPPKIPRVFFHRKYRWPLGLLHRKSQCHSPTPGLLHWESQCNSQPPALLGCSISAPALGVVFLSPPRIKYFAPRWLSYSCPRLGCSISAPALLKVFWQHCGCSISAPALGVVFLSPPCRKYFCTTLVVVFLPPPWV